MLYIVHMAARITKRTKQSLKRLRMLGFSIPEISWQSGISRSSVFRLVRNTAILPSYLERLKSRRNAAKIMSEQDRVRAERNASMRISTIGDDALAIMAASLYWAEGSKRDFSFCNSDPLMISTFLYVLRKVFQIGDESIVISIRIYEDLDRIQCLKFWSAITKIGLGKGTSVTVLKGSKAGKLPYGMCRVRIRKGGLLLKEFSAIINRVNALIANRPS